MCRRVPKHPPPEMAAIFVAGSVLPEKWRFYAVFHLGSLYPANPCCGPGRRFGRVGRRQSAGGVRVRQSRFQCLCLVKKQNQNTSIDSSLPLFRSLKELAKICYNFQNSRTFDVAKPLYIMKGGLERYGFGRTI